MLRKRRPDLIVPIRDRRQHKRYLTLRNFGYSVIALLVLAFKLRGHKGDLTHPTGTAMPRGA